MGASIKISSDAKQFQQEMQKVTQDLKVMSSELSVVSTKAQLFGSEQDKLSTKSKELNNTIKGQNTILNLQKQSIQAVTGDIQKYKDRNSELKKSISEVEAKLKDSIKNTGENSKETKQLQQELGKLQKEYNANEKAIDKSTKQVESYKIKMNETEKAILQSKKALEETDKKLGTMKWDEASDKLDKFGKKSKDLGGTLSKGVTAPVMALGAASMVAFNDVDEGLDTIITKTGATGDAMKGFEETFNNVYGSMPTTAEDAGIAIGEINTRFGITGERLEELSRDFLRFAEINGVDLNDSIGKTNRLMKQWNIDSSRTTDLLDMLTMAGQGTGVSLDKLMDSVQTNGAVLKSMGMTLEDSIILLSEFEANGINSESAMMALKKATVSYAKDGKSMTQGLQETVKTIKDAKSETDALKIATEVFGSKGATEMTTAIREGRMELGQFGFKMEEFAGTVKETFDATQDPPDKMKTAMNNLKLTGTALANSIFEVLAPAINSAVEKAKSFNEWFQKLSPTIKKLIVIIGGIAAAIGPVLVVLGGLAGSISKIIALGGKIAPWLAKSKMLGSLKTSLLGVKGAIAGITLPVAGVIAAIAALVGIFIYLYKTNEDFRNNVNVVWEQIKQVIGSVIESIKIIISIFVEGFIQLWKKYGDDITKIATDAFSLITKIVEWFVRVVKDYILPFILWMVNIFQNNLDSIKQIFQGAFKIIGGIIDFFVGLFTGNWSKMWQGVKSIASGAGDILSGIFKVIVNSLGNIWDKLKSLLLKPIEWAKDKIIGVWNGITEPFQKVADSIARIWEGIKSKFKLPHFTVKGSLNPLTWVNNGMPSIGVQWYAKGAIMTKPTIFGVNGNNLMAGGEAGEEAILPLSKLWDELGKNFDKLEQRLNKNSDKHIYITNVTQLDGREIARGTVEYTAEELEELRRQNNYGKGVLSYV